MAEQFNDWTVYSSCLSSASTSGWRWNVSAYSVHSDYCSNPMMTSGWALEFAQGREGMYPSGIEPHLLILSIMCYQCADSSAKLLPTIIMSDLERLACVRPESSSLFSQQFSSRWHRRHKQQSIRFQHSYLDFCGAESGFDIKEFIYNFQVLTDQQAVGVQRCMCWLLIWLQQTFSRCEANANKEEADIPSSARSLSDPFVVSFFFLLQSLQCGF